MKNQRLSPNKGNFKGKEGRTTHINIRCEPEIKEQVKEAAEEVNKTQSDWIIEAIREKL